jgi:mannose-6-phosphate isomerase-like protein (cupin superfamily)
MFNGMPMKSEYADATAYDTKDGSEIRELMHPDVHGQSGCRNQSLAEARVAPGATTRLHRHARSEEIYHITAGRGRLRLGDHWLSVAPGDSICITPGTPHQLHNDGAESLVVLCVCAPAYAHDDTELLDRAP